MKCQPDTIFYERNIRNRRILTIEKEKKKCLQWKLKTTSIEFSLGT